MKHWKAYLERQKPEYCAKIFPPGSEADIILIIPCCNEPGLIDTLQNIYDCKSPYAKVLVAVIINAGEHFDEVVILQNRITYKDTMTFAESALNADMTFFPLLFENLPRKHAGVGLARKIGMDLAVEHFYRNSKPDGLIVSLDADSTVSNNFFVSINDSFKSDKSLKCTIHNVRHRVGDDSVHLKNAVRQFEAYLKYFSDSLKQIGFPYWYHTVGSAFAVSADAYVSVGGMGRQQGGEDFYFLQKIFALGAVKVLDDVTIYPLARFSERVPFGTGRTLQKILNEPDAHLKVYSRQSFFRLKQLFDFKEEMYGATRDKVYTLISTVHPAVRQYLDSISFIDMVEDCNQNSASRESFVKRFFHHFNAFRVIKYLNSIHPEPFAFERIADIAGTV